MTYRWAFYLSSVPFTRDVVDGRASLGGSESACVGLMRALVAQGHDVFAFADQLAPDATGPDHAGVIWVPASDLQGPYLHHTWDVLVSLRMWTLLEADIPARLRLLWNQDLFTTGGVYGDKAQEFFAQTATLDGLVYVSDYHRSQWEQCLPDATPLGWVTKNGYDATLVPTSVVKDWRRIVHISRPERGLGPLLAMWPALKARVPEAELRLCRYRSMYDGEGGTVKAVCEAFDARVAALNATVGGITWLGSLGKADLYREIAEAAVMWYPGVSDFAETSCIAAIEAQACGTPLVLSARGALTETAPWATFVEGDAYAADYQAQSLDAVVAALHGCRDNSVDYRRQQLAGRAHVNPAYTYPALAREWADYVSGRFAQRQGLGVLRRLLRDDDHVAASWYASANLPDSPERTAALERCARVIAGRDHTPDDYAERALSDPIKESQAEPRFGYASAQFGTCTHVLDVACGNGAAALRLLQDHPTIRVTGIDYSAGNIARAQAAAETLGVADRATFLCLPVYDYDTHDVTAAFRGFVDGFGAAADGAFVGEFLEHVANAPALINAVEACVQDGGTIVYTTPHGPYADLLDRAGMKTIKRGHVHSFEIDDWLDLLGAKADLSVQTLHVGWTGRGDLIGVWLVRYTTQKDVDRPTGDRDIVKRCLVTRPDPTLTVGMITKDAANDLGRCLDAVWDIADEIIVGDTGSTDATLAIAQDYGAAVLRLPAVRDIREGFAGARNAVLEAATGEWFLWIDADEVMVEPQRLRRYLSGGAFQGYAIKQLHLMADMPYSPTDPRCFDTPVRLFRRGDDIRFYGCVHEQPQMGDCNGDITPALQLHDVSIAHYGYRHERDRKRKSDRNIPLLLRNREVFPDRILNDVLEIREGVLRANDAAAHGRPDVAEALYRGAIEKFARFRDPADKHHALARPWYEAALEALGEGWEFEVAFAGTYGKLNGRHAAPKRFRALSVEEVEAYVAHQVAPVKAKLAPPPLWTAPLVPVRQEVSA